MSRPTLSVLGLLALGCSGPRFEVASGSDAYAFVSRSGRVSADGSQLSLCGHFRFMPRVIDSGGQVCFDLVLDRSTLTAPTTLTIEGLSTSEGFTPGAANSPQVLSASLRFDCVCRRLSPTRQHGRVSLTRLEAHRIAGELQLQVHDASPGTVSDSPGNLYSVASNFDLPVP
jgi:hypothetical protein